MKLILEVDLNQSIANQIGEILRREFFGTFPYNWDLIEGLGEEITQYSGFDGYLIVHIARKEFPQYHWIKAEWYYMDGEYDLQFIFEDGSILFNNCAKKDNRWEFKK